MPLKLGTITLMTTTILGPMYLGEHLIVGETTQVSIDPKESSGRLHILLTIGYIILCQLHSTFSCIGTLFFQLHLLIAISILLTTCFFLYPKEICNLPKSMANIETHLHTKTMV